MPEKGLIRTSFVSSVGIPKKLKNGLKKVEIAFDRPLTSNNSVKTNMLTKYGKMLVAKGIADFAPCVKAS